MPLHIYLAALYLLHGSHPLPELKLQVEMLKPETMNCKMLTQWIAREDLGSRGQGE